jgi:subtilisin
MQQYLYNLIEGGSMKYWRSIFLIVGVSLLFFVSGCVEHEEIIAPTQKATEAQSLAKIAEDGRYLVGFKNTPDPGIITAAGGRVVRTFSIVPAAAVQMSPQAADALSRNPSISYVEPDYTVYAHSQTVPWGIDRVFGNETYSFPTWNTTKGSGIKVAILDTGIDENHQDLKVAGGVTTVDATHWGDDGNGHGTHVAGTVAALDNTLGVVGVAPSVDLYAVKVLSDGGSGSVSSVVAGIEWAVAESIPILNMSLGSSSDSQTLRNACDAAYAAGHLIVSSAGNSGNPGGRGDNVGYPAKYESVIAVASSTVNDTRSSFSSTGPAVELIAPGSSILSTLPGNSYGTYSGTSMASPHVAGVAALTWAANTDLSNAQLRQILRDTAEDLGLSSNHQGYGLARADLAVKAAGGTVPVVNGNIEGTVTDAETNSGIGGAIVNVDGTNYSATTNSNGNYTITGVPVGSYTVTASASGYQSSSLQVSVNENETSIVNFSLSPEDDVNGPELGTLVSVTSIDYSTSGGRLNDRHLHVTLTLLNDLGNPVANASVSINLNRDGTLYSSANGTTGSNGTVTFSFNNAPSGEYTTVVTGVTASGLVWDGVTPDNSFEK